MNIGLFFNRRLQIGNIFFDGHLNEMATFDADITSIPVEFGANTVDNVVIQTTTLQFTAFMSETPAFSLGPSGLFNNFKRTTDALDVLRQAQVARQVMDVYCNIGYFRNMMIKKIEPKSNMGYLTTIPVDITFQEIIFVGETTMQDPNDDQFRDFVSRGSLQAGDNPL